MRQGADGLAEVGSLTINPTGILEHAYHETELAEQAVFALAGRGDVTLGKSTYRHGVVHRLQQRIRVRVENVGLESAV